MSNEMQDLVKIQHFLNERLTKLQWFYSPILFNDLIVDFERIDRMHSVSRKPVLVLDRNILSRLIKVVSNGYTDEGSTQDIAILVAWSALNNVDVLPYFALNELAEGTKNEVSAQREYSMFKSIFTDIPLIEWLAVALGFEKEIKTLIKIDIPKDNSNIVFSGASVDFLSNYAAMLHLASVLRTDTEQISRFRNFFEWFYNNLKVSRYTEVYVIRLLLGIKGYKEPKKIHGKSFDDAVKGCQNQARDLSYLTQLSIDRWPIEQYEPIMVTDDNMLGDIFLKGCFNTEAIREFENNVKTSSRKIAEWVNELIKNHEEVIVDDYEEHCKKIVKQELDFFRESFGGKNEVVN